MQKLIREKKHRLLPDEYRGFVAVVFTANIRYRKRFFVSDIVFKIFQEILLNELAVQNCSSYVYLFMPDHIHFILAGEKEDASVKDCMDMFKQRTGFWLHKNNPAIHWQKDYYDHIIRNEQDMSAQVRYILRNPVSAGLTNTWKEYPYKSSTKYSFEEWDDEL